jgi:hypothetical protein
MSNQLLGAPMFAAMYSPDYKLGNGYVGYSKSYNAVVAEQQGLMTASAAAKALKVSTEAIRKCMEPAEWHHTSCHYNVTYYYDCRPILAALSGQRCWMDEDGEVIEQYSDDQLRQALELLERMREFDRQRKAVKKQQEVKIIEHCRVYWFEWEGTRMHPKKVKKTIDDCTVIDKGGKFIELKCNRSGRTTRRLRANVTIEQTEQ